jgi:hypothetical protein
MVFCSLDPIYIDDLRFKNFMILVETLPGFLLIFSPIKTADFRYYSSRQMMAILCCVALKAVSAAHVQYTVYRECTRSHQLPKVTLRCHTNSVH